MTPLPARFLRLVVPSVFALAVAMLAACGRQTPNGTAASPPPGSPAALVSCGNVPANDAPGKLVAQLSTALIRNGQLVGTVLIKPRDSSTPVAFTAGPPELFIVRRGVVVGRRAIAGATVAAHYRVTKNHPALLSAAVDVKGVHSSYDYKPPTSALFIVSTLVTTCRSLGWVVACRFRQAM